MLVITDLLDDPLSAVDAHTGAHIFNQCIDGLLKDKTVILPVHNLSFLDRSDYVVVLEDNAISEQGTYPELMANREGSFSTMMNDFSAQDDGSDGAERKTEKKPEDDSVPQLSRLLLRCRRWTLLRRRSTELLQPTGHRKAEATVTKAVKELARKANRSYRTASH